MKDEVHRLVDEERLRDVLVHEDELRAAQVLDVGERAGVEVVDADHAMPASEQGFTQVRAEKAAATGHERGRHATQSRRGTKPPLGLLDTWPIMRSGAHL